MTAASCVRSGWSRWDEWLEDPAPPVSSVAPAWAENRYRPEPTAGPRVTEGQTWDEAVRAALDALPSDEAYTVFNGRELGALVAPGRRAMRCPNPAHNDGHAEGAPPASCVMWLDEGSFVCLGASCGASGGRLKLVSYLLGHGGRIDGAFYALVRDVVGARLGLNRADFADEGDHVADDELESVLEAAMEDLMAGMEPVAAPEPTPKAELDLTPSATDEDEHLPDDELVKVLRSGRLDAFDVQMNRIDTTALLLGDPPEPEWLLNPILALGRITAIVAAAKSGKSWLAFEMAVCAAIGRGFLGMPPGPGMRVLYTDYEMSIGDIRERLFELDLSDEEIERLAENLVYLSLPPLLALGTAQGGNRLVQVVQHYEAVLVVFDTVSRIVVDENSNTDIQNLYTYTFGPLKRRGVTVLRLDHTGHGDGSRARGGAAKSEDADVVWTMKATDGGRVLTCTHQRMSWVPEKVVLSVREPGGTGPIHTMVGAGSSESWPAGTKALADWLDAVGAPVDVSYRVARRDYLKDPKVNPDGPDQVKAGTDLLRAALKFRKLREAGEVVEDFLEDLDDLMAQAIPEDIDDD